MEKEELGRSRFTWTYLENDSDFVVTVWNYFVVQCVVCWGDYRECSIVLWSTNTYTVLTSTKTMRPIHDLVWDPYTVNEFASVGEAGTLSFWLLDETQAQVTLSVHEAQLPDDLLGMHHMVCILYTHMVCILYVHMVCIRYIHMVCILYIHVVCILYIHMVCIFYVYVLCILCIRSLYSHGLFSLYLASSLCLVTPKYSDGQKVT